MQVSVITPTTTSRHAFHPTLYAPANLLVGPWWLPGGCQLGVVDDPDMVQFVWRVVHRRGTSQLSPGWEG